MVGWPRGEARDCKSLYTGSNPVPTSTSFAQMCEAVSGVIDFMKEVPRTIGSAVEHHIDIVGVTGSIPVSSTFTVVNFLATSKPVLRHQNS